MDNVGINRKESKMKKLILMALFVLAVTPLVFAGDFHNVAGAKFDAPNLIGLKQISPDLFLGLEASKDIVSNVGYSDFAGIEDDFNASVYAKATLHTCFFNCPSK